MLFFFLEFVEQIRLRRYTNMWQVIDLDMQTLGSVMTDLERQTRV